MEHVIDHARRVRNNIQVSPYKANLIIGGNNIKMAQNSIDGMWRCIMPKYHNVVLDILTVAYVDALFKQTTTPYTLQQKSDFLKAALLRNRASREK